MATTGAAQATIGLDYSRFETAAKAVMRLNSIMAGAISSAVGNIVATAFTKGAGAVKQFFGSIGDNLNDAFKLGESMANMAKATNSTVTAWMSFTTAMDKGISRIEALDVLGKNAEILERNANLFRDISIKFSAVGERLKGFWLGVAEKIAPVLNPLLDKLMTIDLSGWGKAFAEPIANTVAAVYQLFADEKLWSTMKDALIAAITAIPEMIRWAAQLMGELFNHAITAGFNTSLTDILQSWLTFCETAGKTFGDTVGDAFYDVMTDVMEQWYEILNELNAFANSLGFGDKSKMDAKHQERINALESRRSSENPTYDIPSSGGFLDSFQKILENNPFTPSAGLQGMFDDLMNTWNEAKGKFQQDGEGSKTFSNTKAMMNFGVDSLQSAGGGGGVGGGAMQMLDYAAEQTALQRQFVEKQNETLTVLRSLGVIAPGGSNFSLSQGTVVIK